MEQNEGGRAEVNTLSRVSASMIQGAILAGIAGASDRVESARSRLEPVLPLSLLS